MSYPEEEHPVVEERCWSNRPVVSGPDQPCLRKGEGSLGLCPAHAGDIVGEAARAEAERLAQGLPPRLEDPAAQSRILTAMQRANR